MKKNGFFSVIVGAAFLMATSAVGPGFLTQTTKFTSDLAKEGLGNLDLQIKLAASFGFVILASVILDIFAQLNIWRVLTVSGKRAQDLANETILGSGYALAGLVAFGGLVFNIGNIAGAALGLNVLFGLKGEIGAVVSAIVGIIVFSFKEFGKAMDFFVKILGLVMLILIVSVVVASPPPLAEAGFRTIFPATVSPFMIVTLVGGTVGGYITFAGAHRLIDAGVTGRESLSQVNRGAVTGILLTAIIRFLLFLAALSVISLGLVISEENPPASVFQHAVGNAGYRIFGIVMWSAAITSVVGAAFTSVSFLKTFHHKIAEKDNFLIIGFIVFSTLIFLIFGRPVTVLVWAGTINGFILPIGLSLILLAYRRKTLPGDYRHPLWLEISGWLVVLMMFIFSVSALYDAL